MIKHVFENYDECYYEDVCDNGLKVIVFPKNDFVTSSCALSVDYGSIDINQMFNGEKVKFPAGVAHFLEHKLFENDEEDIMTQFISLGANVNAYTSYAQTCYYFDTSESDITEPLNLLMKFVQKLDITDKSVEKEKGIIVEEFEMYQQRPDSRLLNELFKSMYFNFNIKDDIAGDVESINSISKDILDKAYLYNYHPSKMMLVVVGPQDPEKIIDIVKKSQTTKNYDDKCALTEKIIEPKRVVNKKSVINMDVMQPKVGLGIKLDLSKQDKKERLSLEWSLRLLLEAYFSSLNEEYQSWLDNKDISSMFYFENDTLKNQGWMIFMDDTKCPYKFKRFINYHLNKLKDCEIDAKLFEGLKRRSFGTVMRSFDGVNAILMQHVRLQEYGINTFEMLDIINDITVEKAINYFRSIDISHQSLVIIKK